MKCCCGNCDYYKYDLEYEGQEAYYCDNPYSEQYHEWTDDDYICGQWEAE